MTASTSKILQILKMCRGFETVIKTVDIISAGNGSCIAELKIGKEHINMLGKMHGGFAATLVDTLSGAALLTHEKGDCCSLSVSITLDYLKSAREGDHVIIDSRTLKVGRSLAYLEVEIKDKESGDLLVKGKHTKYLLT